ncbi:MAG: cysteine--tRNA ligase [Hyphomicrobiales bacterium]|nr:MAG: cysteine--tRNA ligase [Hyphomicrobiales bacterium]
MSLTLYNTLTRRKEPFRPIDPANVRMYVCGPTVYDYAHIGNARPVIVFDVLFRLLRHVFGETHVTYARNITDVDDKINARAAQEFPSLPLNEAIRQVTTKTETQFHADIAALGVLPPTHEPRATEFIRRDDNKVDMVRLIEDLVARGHAYVAQDHVLFDVASMPDYGRLANRSLEEMEAGARVDVAPYKRGAMDFVLWKPSKPGEPAWPSPAGIATPGRPGWHIECSAMAGALLGDVFDIHGGGIDLVFPHHENELAQSRCAHGTAVMANYWMHNGFLQVEGEKMSKSLGNFITIHELLETKTFGQQPWHGRVIKFAMLGTHYRQPIDWTVGRLVQARATLMDFADVVSAVSPADAPHADVIAALSDDLNTPSAISILHGIAKSAQRNAESAAQLKATLQFLGVYGEEKRGDFAVGVEARSVDAAQVESLIGARNAARKAKDFKEADRIRDELAAMGVQLKDAKDKTTGEIVTTWEVKG